MGASPGKRGRSNGSTGDTGVEGSRLSSSGYGLAAMLKPKSKRNSEAPRETPGDSYRNSIDNNGLKLPPLSVKNFEGLTQRRSVISNAPAGKSMYRRRMEKIS